MGRYNEDEIVRETYGGPPKGWSDRVRRDGATHGPWIKPESNASPDGDAQCASGWGAAGVHPPHQTHADSSSAE